jgi:transcriptional regulator with XRE-family HTH domain
MTTRARLTQVDPDFMKAVAAALRQYRDGSNPENRILSDSELAGRLGVSKASLSNYLQRKQVIGGETLRRLLVELSIRIVYDGTVISATVPDQPAPPTPVTAPTEQISFIFEPPCVVDETAEHITVRVDRKESGRAPLKLEVRIAS